MSEESAGSYWVIGCTPGYDRSCFGEGIVDVEMDRWHRVKIPKEAYDALVEAHREVHFWRETAINFKDGMFKEREKSRKLRKRLKTLAAKRITL